MMPYNELEAAPVRCAGAPAGILWVGQSSDQHPGKMARSSSRPQPDQVVLTAGWEDLRLLELSDAKADCELG
jgi:hypothetical protein